MGKRVRKKDIKIHSEVLNNFNRMEKYELRAELNFLRSNCDAKVRKITEKGFKHVWSVLNGSDNKAKEQYILINSNINVLLDSLIDMISDEVDELKVALQDITEKLDLTNDAVIKMAALLLRIPPDSIEDDEAEIDRIRKQLTEVLKNMLTYEKRIQEDSFDDNITSWKICRINPREKAVISCGSITSERLVFDQSKDKSHYRLSQDKLLNITTSHDYDLVVAPFSANINPQIASISLADYYMFLWFHNTEISKRIARPVCMIDYYDHSMYVNGYITNQDGTSYKKLFSGLEIAYNRLQKNIILDIERQFEITGNIKSISLQNKHKKFNSNSIQIFKTFIDENNYIEKKLDLIKVSDINYLWENILTQNNSESDNLFDLLEELAED